MTPLAQKLAGELLLPQHKRRVVGPQEHIHFSVHPRDFKFFDMRKVFASVPDHSNTYDPQEAFPLHVLEEVRRAQSFTSDLCFLPATNCWFETQEDFAVLVSTVGKHRHELHLLVEHDKHILLNQMGHVFTQPDHSGLRFKHNEAIFEKMLRAYGHDRAEKMHRSCAFMLYVSLVCINSARIALATEHMPGERERQKSLRGKSLVGKFPLRAWTEIVLVPGTTHMPDPQRSATTGERAQHFVRAHLRRYRNGKTVVVREHHRGNPAIGMAQTRYRVENPNVQT